MQKLVRTALAVATLAAAVANVTHAAEEKKASKWYDNMKIKGDLRYRYQQDDGDDYVAAVGATPATTKEADRSRNRIRVRLGTYGTVNDMMDYGVRLATGGDATHDSTNQSLTGGNFGKYAISLDQAYVNMKFFPDTKLTLGKMENPFWAPQSSGLVWDGDINPEGMAFNYASGHFWATVAHLLPDSDTSGGSQQLSALQLGFKTGGFTGGATYYNSSSDPATPATKATMVTGASTGADMYDVGLEYAFNISELKAAVYGDYLGNTDDATASDQEYSYTVGFNLKGKEWKAGIAYLDLGDDGASGLQDSDFNAAKSDSEGYRVNVAYSIAKNAEAGLTYFAWEKDVSSTTAMKNGLDGSTLQADLAFKF